MGVKVKSNIDDQIERLKELNKKGHPHAVAKTLNKVAYNAQQHIRKVGLKKQFTLRNTYTTRSIVFKKTPPRTNIALQESEVGTTSKYLKKHPDGGTIRKKNNSSFMVPTKEARVTKSKNKPVKKAYRLSNTLKVRKIASVRGKTKRDKIRVLINNVAQGKSGTNKLVFLPFRKVAGIYKVTTKGSKKRRPKLKLIYAVGKKRIKLKKKDFLAPSVKFATKHMPNIYQAEVEKQLLRLKAK